MKKVISLGNKCIRIAYFLDNDTPLSSLPYLMAYNYFKTILNNHKDIYIEIIHSKQIHNNYISRFDVLFIPGGDAEDKHFLIQKKGREKIVEFIKNGGGYMGICAGAYLCLSHVDDPVVDELVEKKVLDGSTKHWHYGLVKYTNKDLKHWNRGTGLVSLEYTKFGKKLLKIKKKKEAIVDCHYGNGPICRKLNVDEMKYSLNTYDNEVIATYFTEMCKVKGTEGQMVNTPAMICSKLGKGRIVLCSPHPEKNPKEIAGKQFLKLFYWLAKRDFK